MLAAAVFAYYFLKPPVHLPIQPGYQPTTPVPELKGVPKITLKGKDVVVYVGNGKLKIPFGTTTSSRITASAELKPSEGGYKAISVYNTKTGGTEIIAEEQKRPMFALGGKTEIGIRGGFSTNGQIGQVFARQDLLRVDNLHLAVYGDAGIVTNTGVKPDAKAMLELSYRW
jgi:hypothetical protein